MATTIYIIRHGRTKANEEQRFAGRTDEPLLPVGREQAKEAAQFLVSKPITAIYSSPLARTMETAQILAQIIKAPLKIEEGLNEINIPQWDGKLKADLIKDLKSNYAIWKQAPASFAKPNAETLQELQQRAVNTIEKIFSKHDNEQVVIVTHLAVARTILLHYLGKPLTEYRNINVANAAPIALIKDNDHNYYIQKLEHGS